MECITSSKKSLDDVVMNNVNDEVSAGALIGEKFNVLDMLCGVDEDGDIFVDDQWISNLRTVEFYEWLANQ